MSLCENKETKKIIFKYVNILKTYLTQQNVENGTCYYSTFRKKYIFLNTNLHNKYPILCPKINT